MGWRRVGCPEMRSLSFWILAFLLTAASAIYQRVTGPTHPVKERLTLHQQQHTLRLPRSHGGPGDLQLRLPLADPAVHGSVAWRRFKTGEAWTSVPLQRDGDALLAKLPHQPPAGKLEYRVTLEDGSDSLQLPSAGPNVVRFKGGVPTAVIIVHVLGIFSAMLLSTRTALEAFMPSPRYLAHAWWTVGLMLVGGLVLGPIVQKYAFGAYWTGWPVGTDLTDNKTAVAFLAWLLALAAILRGRPPKRWVLGAALVTLLVFLVPHSMLGSELDYSQVQSPR